MASNGTIHVEIDPTTPLPERYLGSSEDGPQYGPMSLYDAIVETAAHKLVSKALKDDGLKDSYHGLVDRVKAIRDEQIRENVAPLIAEALAAPLRRTNNYGEATGAEVTLRELLAEEVKSQLAQPTGSSYDRKTTVLQQVIKEEVNRALADELKAALNAGKSEVLAAVRQQGVQVIEDTLKKAMPL